MLVHLAYWSVEHEFKGPDGHFHLCLLAGQLMSGCGQRLLWCLQAATHVVSGPMLPGCSEDQPHMVQLPASPLPCRCHARCAAQQPCKALRGWLCSCSKGDLYCMMGKATQGISERTLDERTPDIFLGIQRPGGFERGLACMRLSDSNRHLEAMQCMRQR